ncbi:protein-L-isoaspartate O-methyltransferase [Novosphingobium sp. Gsoil 351]|uniref:protein-L-isoaspartate O-methyltransferase family protein n=1 Tax=Novosphingobium sp. Gsoil 351 TaxID=2675225 RepID=UPI0012B4BCDC|nr:protein-L-isoaspartate O-methyltransferase [Novosphingobium sp. Gsoil 351]QGN54870.1 protein-L-isoaspartate O-methyltransferase [Novosphingobium sp. Gsoil 351]
MTVLTEPALDSAVGMDAARRAMIDSQLRPSGVNDPAVLAAFNRVQREDFVPASARAVAYMDRAVPLGAGKVLAPPLTHGLMLMEAAPATADRALLVDGGSGYLAALLKPLVGSLEVIEPGAAASGDGYTLMMIDGGIEQLPDALAAKLGDDGRVITGLIERGVSRLATGRKAAAGVGFLTLGEADFAALPEYALPAKWSF